MAAMLLSDWVFSQTPKASAVVANALSKRDAIRRLLSGTIILHTGTTVQIPEACGGVEIVSRAFDLLLGEPDKQDLSHALADFICVNSELADVDARWLSAMTREASEEDISRWLRVGSHLGSLRRVGHSDLLAVVGANIHSPQCAWTLCHADRYDCILNSEDDATRFIEYFLADAPSTHLTERAGLQPLFLLPVFLGLQSYFFSFRGQYRIKPLMDIVSRFSSEARPKREGELSFNTSLEKQAFDISCKICEAFEGGWPIRSGPFEMLVEECRKNWGDRPAIISLANSVCQLSGRTRLRTGDVSIFDWDRPVCDRIRLAKARSRDAVWWRETMRQIKTPTDCFLYDLLFWTWAPTRMALEMSDDLSAHLDGLGSIEWRRLLHFLDMSHRNRPLGVRKKEIVRPEPVSSRRLALMLGLREPSVFGLDTFLQYFADWQDGSRTMAAFRQTHAFEAALTGKFDWTKALSVIRSTYSQGVHYALANITYSQSRRLTLPEEVCEQVLSHATDYPLALWDVAERTASMLARRAVRPVAEVARQERWFED
jgi:hypothetical protein